MGVGVGCNKVFNTDKKINTTIKKNAINNFGGGNVPQFIEIIVAIEMLSIST